MCGHCGQIEQKAFITGTRQIEFVRGLLIKSAAPTLKCQKFFEWVILVRLLPSIDHDDIRCSLWFWVILFSSCLLHYVDFSDFKIDLYVINACTLVPTVFLRNRKTEFELAFSFFVYRRHRKTEFEIPFSFSVYLLHWKWNSSRLFLFFVFPRLWITEF